MANTYKTFKDRGLEITPVDSHWKWSEHFSEDMGVLSIQFNPAAANDACVIKGGYDETAGGNPNGPSIFDVKCADSTDQRKADYFGERLQPYLNFGSSSFTSGAKIIIIATERRFGPR